MTKYESGPDEICGAASLDKSISSLKLQVFCLLKGHCQLVQQSMKCKEKYKLVELVE